MGRTLSFYTDGAFSSKSEMGGWCSVCLEDGVLIDQQSGHEAYTTNNRMELMAVLSALENVDTIQTPNTSVFIYTDSAYISNCFKDKWYTRWLSNGWKTADKKAVKNQDLWSRIIALYIKNNNRFEQVQISKVKGHSDNHWNNYVDNVAVQERKVLEF